MEDHRVAEGRAVVSGISVPYKRDFMELILFFHHVGTWQEGAIHKSGSEPQQMLHLQVSSSFRKFVTYMLQSLWPSLLSSPSQARHSVFSQKQHDLHPRTFSV